MSADVWLPGAYHDPGENAGYRSGRSRMDRAVAHYTVGSDSRNVGRDGYFHFLIHRDASRENGCTQYAEIDAVTWHGYKAGHYDANSAGPGIEWERRVVGGINDEGLSDAEPLTPNQIEWGARLVPFLAEWGIPPALYDGPRYGCDHWRGWVNHQALDSDRSDGLLRSEWDAITGSGFLMALSDDQQRELYDLVRAMGSTGMPAFGLKNLFEYASMMAQNGVDALDLPNLFDGQHRILGKLDDIEQRLDALDGGGKR